jgi:hypothetical protein
MNVFLKYGSLNTIFLCVDLQILRGKLSVPNTTYNGGTGTGLIVTDIQFKGGRWNGKKGSYWSTAGLKSSWTNGNF